MDGEDRIRALYHIWLDGLTVTPPPCAALGWAPRAAAPYRADTEHGDDTKLPALTREDDTT